MLADTTQQNTTWVIDNSVSGIKFT